MITGKNVSKVLRKDISCQCNCKFDGRKRTSDQWWNNDNVGKDYIWNPSTCNCKNGKYLARITGDSTIMSDEK